jgi:glycosyltransferase involved in cell wall biosynthesis
MPNETPLLTIAVPTYNRAQYLDQLLSKILEQISDDARVELIVSDNASPDSTFEVVSGYLNRGAAIRYIRNETNVGADRNILQCYEQASGKYVWILSDDDLIEPGTVQRVMNALSSGKYDLVFIWCYSFDGDYRGPKRFDPKADLEFERAEDLAQHVHVFFTFISAVVINKERNSSTSHQSFDSLLDTGLVQLGPFYTALNLHRRSLLIRDPLIAARGNSNVGYALYRVFGPTLTEITRTWIKKRAIQHAIINGTIRRFFPQWIMMSRKSQASKIPENPHMVLRSCFGSDPWYWVFDYPIYALPLPLAKGWWLVVRVVNRLDSLIMNMQASS